MQYTTAHPVQESAPPAKILMSAGSGDQSVHVIEYPDGSLSITVNGTAPPHYHWQPHQVEACIRTYMRLLRR